MQLVREEFCMFIMQGLNCTFSVKEKTKNKRHQYEQLHDTVHQRDVGQQNKNMLTHSHFREVCGFQLQYLLYQVCDVNKHKQDNNRK